MATLHPLGNGVATVGLKAEVELSKEFECLVAEDLIEPFVHCARDENLRGSVKIRIHL